MSLVGFAVQAVVALVVAVFVAAMIETARRMGFDPVGSIASFVSRRNAAGDALMPGLSAPAP